MVNQVHVVLQVNPEKLVPLVLPAPLVLSVSVVNKVHLVHPDSKDPPVHKVQLVNPVSSENPVLLVMLVCLVSLALVENAVSLVNVVQLVPWANLALAVFPVFLVMALPCPSSSLPTGSNSSASSSLASANLSDNPPGYDTLMNSQLPSYDDSIVQKTNLPAQVLTNKKKLCLTILPSSLLLFFLLVF